MANIPIYDAMGNVTGYQEEITDTPAAATSVFTMDYYRSKVQEFQNVLNNLDATAVQVAYLIDENITPELTADLGAFMAQYDAKKGYYRAAAEGLNLAINGVNAFGANMPPVTVPATLGLAPLALGGAVAAAIAAAAALITWGRDWMAGVNDRLKTEMVLGKIEDPVKRDAAATAVLEIEANTKAAEASPLSQISTLVKWGAIAALAYFAFQAYQQTRD